MDHTIEEDVQISIATDDKHEKDMVAVVVDIHMQTFAGFFLTFLGRGFLSRLYKGFITHPHSNLLVAYKNNKVIGFLAYSEDLSGLYKFLIKRSLLPFAWSSLGALCRKPSALIRLVRAFLKPRESKRDENYIELSSIGVLPEMKNRHVGSLLIEKLKDQFDPHRFAYIKLETDAVNNDGGNHFYIRNGFRLANTYETPEGRLMNEYRWSNR